MPQSHRLSEDKLAQAARVALLQQGVAECSARTIAGLAGTTASAINYNYGGIKQLYNTVFATALTEAAAWTSQHLDDLRALPSGPATAAFALEQTIHNWTTHARQLAILYQEALIAPDIDPALPRAWVRQWEQFWSEVGSIVGADAAGARLMHMLFQSEALYAISAWRPALEQGALRDLCAHVGALAFTVSGAPSTGALAAAERQVRLALPEAVPETARTIMMKAVDVVADLGLSGLTHRAVAARCGVTAGAVAHYFRTAEDLLAGAIQGQVMILQARASGANASADDAGLSVAAFSTVITRSACDAANRPVIRGRRRLFLATIRSPKRALAGATVRFAQGATITGILRAHLGDASRASLHGSVLSRLISSLDITTLSADDSDASTLQAAQDIARLFQAFEARRQA